jgi:hypothetical protein
MFFFFLILKREELDRVDKEKKSHRANKSPHSMF